MKSRKVLLFSLVISICYSVFLAFLMFSFSNESLYDDSSYISEISNGLDYRVKNIYEKESFLTENDGTIRFENKNAFFYRENTYEIASNSLGLFVITLKPKDINGSVSVFVKLLDGNERKIEEMKFYCAGSKFVSIYYPIDKTFSKIKVNSDDEISVKKVTYSEFGSGVQKKELKSGMFYAESVQTSYLETPVLDIKGRAIETDGEYLYIGGQGTLYIYKIYSNGAYERVSALEGLGQVIWNLSLCKSRNLLCAACRTDGIFLIDISDKNNPFIVSSYYTKELATSVSIHGDFLVASSRYFGTEIIDIKDKHKPSYIGRAWCCGEEFQSSVIFKNHLFVSVYAQRKLKVFNIQSLDSIEFVKEIQLDGDGYFLDVYNDFLYVSTGSHSTYNYKNYTDIGYGYGNGCEIFDVSNPQETRKVSVIKFEGRLSGGKHDVWGVKVSNGIAYVYNRYNGVNIYQLSDSSSPTIIAKIKTPVLKNSNHFVDYSAEGVFPYNAKEWMNAPILDVAIGTGKLFMICPEIGVYCADFAQALSRKMEIDYHSENLAKEKDNCIAISLFHEGIVCANGINGLSYYLNYESFGDPTSHLETNTFIFDVKVTNDGFIYCAEGRDGIGCYSVEDNKIVLKRRFKVDEGICVKDIVINEDCGYLIARAGSYYFKVFKLPNAQQLELIELNKIDNIGSLYYREIGNGFTDDGSCFVKGTRGICHITSNGTRFERYSSPYVSEHGGLCVHDGNLYIPQGRKIIKMNINELGKYQEEQNDIIQTPDNLGLNGKIQILGNLLLCIKQSEKQVIIFKEESDSFVYKQTYNFNDFPDYAVFTSEEKIIIPLGNSGIIHIDSREM